MRLGDGTRAIILVGLGVTAIISYGVHTTAGVVDLAISLLVVSFLLETHDLALSWPSPLGSRASTSGAGYSPNARGGGRCE